MTSRPNPYQPHLHADVLADEGILQRYNVKKEDMRYPGPNEMPVWLLADYQEERDKHSKVLRDWLLNLEIPADVMRDATEVMPSVLDRISHNNEAHVKIVNGVFTSQKNPTSSFADCLAEIHDGQYLYTRLHASSMRKAYLAMHRTGKVLDRSLLSRRAPGDSVRACIYNLPFAELGSYWGSSKVPVEREAQHIKKSVNVLVEKARQIKPFPPMEIVHEMAPGAPFFAQYGIEASFIACSGSAKWEAKDDNPGPFLQFNTFDNPVNGLAGAMPLRLRRPAATRYYALARYFADMNKPILPPRVYNKDNAQYADIADAWKAIYGSDFPDWQDDMAARLCDALRRGIKQVCGRLGPIDHNKCQLGRWHGALKLSHLRDPLVAQLLLDSAAPIPVNYTGVRKFGGRSHGNEEEIDKEVWKEMSSFLGGSVEANQLFTRKEIERTKDADVPAQPVLTKEPTRPSDVAEPVDERQWRIRTIQKGTTSYYLEYFDKSHKAALKIQGENGQTGLL
ncbi:hypothetical protein QFC20_007503 [Naganishia adeliensis]|uniref:Uncharacterized protein n=1 Tax=Naganishia adeliensis TaxID=92952 RepID=A0ACC2UZZ9_9TREE|nr:hypothetical protein QFC20_007503 [Naganishia adeliensis]